MYFSNMSQLPKNHELIEVLDVLEITITRNIKSGLLDSILSKNEQNPIQEAYIAFKETAKKYGGNAVLNINSSTTTSDNTFYITYTGTLAVISGYTESRIKG